MAQALPVPDFNAMAADMGTVAQGTNSLGANLAQMQNLPAIDGGAQILQRLDVINQLVGQMNNRIEQMDGRIGQIDGRIGQLDDRIGQFERSVNDRLDAM